MYFRKPAICDTLTPAMREAVLLTINRQSPASKLSDFFRHCQRLVVAMEHQVRCRQLLLQLLPEVPPGAAPDAHQAKMPALFFFF